MKKLLLAIFALTTISSFAEGNFNLYTKVGVDLSSKFSKISDEDGGHLPLPDKVKYGYSFFLEGTKNVTPNLEIGAGIGYIARKGKNFSYMDDFNIPADKISGKMVSYDSVPLYFLAKYNFETDTEFKPYIKTDLGYSFNKINNSVIYENDKKIDGTDGKMTNGLYVGIGVGLEYNNFITDFSYIYTKSKWKDNNDNDKFNNKAIRLSVGYKFNF